MIQMKSKTWLDVNGLRKAINEATVDPKRRCAGLVEQDAKDSMQRGGRVLKIAGKGKGKKAIKRGAPSKPGTPPHSQSGIGKGSIGYSQVGRPPGLVYYIVGPQKPPAGYMGVHEFGGRHHPPRPFMWPALLRKAKLFPQLFRRLPLKRTKSGKAMEARVKAWESKWKKRLA